jgi:mandelamide amidase
VAQVSADVKRDFERYVLPGATYAVSESVYRAAVDVHLPALREVFRRYFAETGVTAIVFPTTQMPATLIGQEEVEIKGKKLPFEAAVSRNIAPGSTAGLPGLVLPAGLGAGLPVAIELDGPAGSDRTMLALGLAVERVLGKLPPPQLAAAAPSTR